MKSQRFLEFFPPPIFLKMPSAGLSVESDTLRLVFFDNKHGRTMLKSADEFKLEPGTIVAGEIAKPEKLAVVLKNIRNEHNVHFVRIAVPEEKSYVFETIIPVPEDGEIHDAVEFSLDQNIPISAADAVFDFAVVEGPFLHNDASSVKVVVSAYPLGLAESWVAVLKQAGIVPLMMVSESQALARSLLVRGDRRSSLLVHFLKDKTIIAVVADGHVRFSTVVSHNIDDANKILKSHEGEKIVESVELLAVKDEIKKVCAYWLSKDDRAQKGSKGIKSLVVSGHVSEMADIAEYLGKHIRVPAFLGNVWQNAFSAAEHIPEIEFEDSLRFATASGVALAD